MKNRFKVHSSRLEKTGCKALWPYGLTALLFMLVPLTLLGQDSTGYFDYFPHAVGNSWEWNDSVDVTITHVTEKNGSSYVYENNRTDYHYRIDPDYKVYQKLDDGSEPLWFILNVSDVDSFETYVWGVDFKVTVYPGKYGIFGEKRPALYFDWYKPNGEFWAEQVLCMDLGMIKTESHAAGESISYVTGCVINGVGYGSLTQMDNPDRVPASYELEQNYPNPFNPATKIVYELAQAGFVELSIFNILGEKVEMLVNGPEGAGRHSVVFDAGNLPAGVYYYRIKSGEFAGTKKMILLK